MGPGPGRFSAHSPAHCLSFLPPAVLPLPVSAKFLSHVRSCPMVLPVMSLLPPLWSKRKSCPTVFAPQAPMLHDAPGALSWIVRSCPNELPQTRFVPELSPSAAPLACAMSASWATSTFSSLTPVVPSTRRSPPIDTSTRSHQSPFPTITSPSIAAALICSFEHVTFPLSFAVSVACSGRCDVASASPTKKVRPFAARIHFCFASDQYESAR